MRMELHLPEQAPLERGDTFGSTRRVRDWLGQLDQGTDREIAARCIKGLQHFNRIQLRTVHRLKVAEQLRPAIRHLIERFIPRISTQRLPLDDASRRNFQALLLLLREASLAYDIVSQSLGGVRRPSRRRLALAIERALYYRGEVMLRSAPVHAPVPQNFWHDSNVLYRLAEVHRCATRGVRNDDLTVARRQRQSPADMYTRLLLFGLAPTDGLRRGQAERLYRRTEDWCRRAAFPATSTGTESVVYFVDLDRPDAPRPGRPDASAGGSVRLLDLGPVLAAAEKALPQAPPEDAVLDADQVDAGALRRLIDNWSGRGQRGAVRAARSEPADVEVSLSRIHARLVKDMTPDEPEHHEPRRPLPGLATLALQTIERPDHVWRRGDKGATGAAVDIPGAWGEREEARAVPGAPSRKTPAAHRSWALVDTSSSGFRLRWDGESSSPANVGELVALRQELPDADESSSAQERWVIGVIRRVRMIDERRFDAGVETLGQFPAPAAMRREPANPHRKRDRGNEPSEPALTLPPLKGREVPPTVMVPAHLFHEGETVELDLGERALRIQLGPARDTSAAFTRFEIAAAPSRGRHASEGRGGDSPKR